MVSKTRRNQGSFPSGCPKYSKIKFKKNKSRQLYLVICCNLFTPKSLKLIFLANGYISLLSGSESRVFP